MQILIKKLFKSVNHKTILLAVLSIPTQKPWKSKINNYICLMVF